MKKTNPLSPPEEILRMRRLEPGDAAGYRALRLEGLRSHPDAFGASWEEEAALPLEEHARRLAQGVVFAAALGADAWAGMAGLMVRATGKQRHKGVLWGMYVPARARGRGVAGGLVAHALDHARELGLDSVLLTVAGHNQAAQALYRSAGFVAYGTEPRALEVDGRYYDEVLMRRGLRTGD